MKKKDCTTCPFGDGSENLNCTPCQRVSDSFNSLVQCEWLCCYEKAEFSNTFMDSKGKPNRMSYCARHKREILTNPEFKNKGTWKLIPPNDKVSLPG